jgi:antitoxin (DNA-binding transcriptional repressor) of toxin-antitoxin stability system
LKDKAMNAVTSREVIHNFSAVAARVAAGEEITVTRYGKPVLKLVQLPAAELGDAEHAALIRKALSFRMTAPYGKAFERSDAYED